MVEGPYARRKFWQMFTVSGGKLDDKGVSIGWKISKSTFRAMIDSALGLDPKDMSEATKAKRVLRGLADLVGHHVRRLYLGRAQHEPPLRRQQQARPRRGSDRTGMAPCPGRRNRAAGARHPVPLEGRSSCRRGAGVEPERVCNGIGACLEPSSGNPGRNRFRACSCGLPVGWPAVAERLSVMNSDEWQAHVTHEAAKAMGEWLEGRGRLHQPIAALTMADLEAMAVNAISRFVVLGMERIRTKANNAEALTRFLLA